MSRIDDVVSVLCYGDSNTYGQRGDDVAKSRWPRAVRWTGRLQALLGPRFHVIEEGLPGRTSNLDRPDRPGRNGLPYLAPCLASHNPLDVVVLMLGTNDLVCGFGRSASQVADAVGELVEVVAEHATGHDQPTEVIVVSPIRIGRAEQRFEQLYGSAIHPDWISTSAELAAPMRTVAHARGCGFVDAALLAEPGPDGVHFTAESHQTFAAHLAGAVRDTLAEH